MIPPEPVIPHLLGRLAKASPHIDAIIIQGGRGLGYGEWERRANLWARSLMARGVCRGDRVALIFDNARFDEAAVAEVAVHKVGAVAVPLGTRFTAVDLESILGHCGARAVVSPPELRPGTRTVAWVASPDELEGHGCQPVRTPVEPGDLAEIIYTSGTTGTPKGVAVTHHDACFALPQPRTERIRYLHTAPLGTNAGQEGLRLPLRGGDKTAVVATSLDPENLCALAEEEHVTSVHLVPTLAHALLDSGALSRHDLSSVRRVVLTGAPSAPTLLARLAEALPGAVLRNVYALTESGPARTIMDYDPRRPSSVGRPDGDGEVCVVDDDGTTVPAGGVGQVLLRRRGAPLRAYYGDPAATAAVHQGAWLRTGDVGYIEDGYLYLLDRRDDLIIRGGLNVASAQVESALYEHPGVTEAAVFGVGHPTLGQEVAAALVVRQPTAVAELQELVRRRISEAAVPRRVTFVDRLPRTASGKVRKRELAEAAAALVAEATHVSPRNATEEAVAAVWRELLDLARVGVHDDFFALGGHSIVAVQAAARLGEALGVSLPITEFFTHPTVAELAEAIDLRLEAPG